MGLHFAFLVGTAEMNKKAIMDQKLKSKYKKDFATLTKLVIAFDPCGLIFGGAPLDEYDCLTQQLLSSIYNGKTRLEIKEQIIYEVDHHFDMPVSKEYEAQFHKDIDKFIDTLKEYFSYIK